MNCTELLRPDAYTASLIYDMYFSHLKTPEGNILICWIIQNWKFYWIMIKKKKKKREKKISTKKTEVAESSSRNLAKTFKSCPLKYMDCLKLCKSFTCSLLQGLWFWFCFLEIHTSISAHNEQFWDDHLIGFPFFWLTYSPTPYLEIFNQMQYLRMNNGFAGLSEVLFTMGEK